MGVLDADERRLRHVVVPTASIAQRMPAGEIVPSSSGSVWN